LVFRSDQGQVKNCADQRYVLCDNQMKYSQELCCRGFVSHLTQGRRLFPGINIR